MGVVGGDDFRIAGVERCCSMYVGTASVYVEPLGGVERVLMDGNVGGEC